MGWIVLAVVVALVVWAIAIAGACLFLALALGRAQERRAAGPKL